MDFLENGMRTASAAQVVPADLIGAMTGISLSDVRRVIAAQTLLIEHGIATEREVTELEAVPTAFPDKGRSERTERAMAYFKRVANTVDPDIKALMKRTLWS